jgi:hypothetical protein
VLFVEQFRIPLQARTIEMPAGLVGVCDGTGALVGVLSPQRIMALGRRGHTA